jgi:hypothetical protein
LAAIVFVNVPLLALCTFTVTVQLLFAGMIAPLKDTDEVVFETAAPKPLQVVEVTAVPVEFVWIVRLLGSVSARLASVRS